MPALKLSVLRPEVWPPLERRLLEASQKAASPATRDVLTRPLGLLSLMAGDAPAALGDDALAADRLRMLLYLAAPFHTLVDEAHELAKAKRGARATEASYEPGVLHHGALALLALAARRVAPAGSEQLFVNIVHGLALSAAPAEVLGRLVPRMPDADGLAVILDTLYLLDAVGAALEKPFLRPFADDPAERGRWRCLSLLLEQHLPAALAEALSRAGLNRAKPPPWDGAQAGGIEDVQPRGARAGEVAVLSGKLEELGSGPKLPKSVRVVFASPDRDLLPAQVRSYEVSASGRELRVVVPEAAHAGWIGFSDDRLIQESNEFRGALRELLPVKLDQRGCLRGAEVPAWLIPQLGVPDPDRPGKLLAVPPRMAGNRWAGPLDSARFDPTQVVAPAPSGTAIAISPPRILAARAYEGACESPLFLGRPLEVAVVVDPGSQSELEMELRLFPAPPDGKPLAPDRPWKPGQDFHFTVAKEMLLDRLVLLAVLLDKKETVANWPVGPLAFLSPRKEQLVLVRPQVLKLRPDGSLEREPAVKAEVAKARLQDLAAQLGVDLAIVELPWVDDELAVLESPLASGDDARVPGLLEALSRRAMLTPHLEGAPWLLLVPQAPLNGDDALRATAVQSGHGYFRTVPAEAARSVTVADQPGLPGLMKILFGKESEERGRASPAQRLRLLGTFDENTVQLDSVQEELRGAGPGAPVKSGLTVATLDRRGRELLVQSVTCLRRGKPAQLAALVPVSPEVSAVEVRRENQRLARIDRTRGNGKLREVALTAPVLAAHQALRWRFSHTQNARPDLSLALGWGRLSTEVLHIDACDREATLRLTRYRHAQKLQLLASDGWNLAEHEVAGDDGRPVAIENPTPVQIRKLSDGRYFADVPAEWDVAWSLDGRALFTTTVVTLPEGARGTLQLEARRNEKSPPVIDQRPVET
jgi:hypothetical protein